jgi:hypothetical protein
LLVFWASDFFFSPAKLAARRATEIAPYLGGLAELHGQTFAVLVLTSPSARAILRVARASRRATAGPQQRTRYTAARMAEPAAVLSLDEAQALVHRDAELDAALRRVAVLDFSMLKAKLVGEMGWTPETCEETEALYRKFLALNLRYPGRKICPTGPVDEFWHAHILDTRAYAADCDALFGGILHHFPYFGLRGPEDRADLERSFQDTIDLFIRHFGVDPSSGDTRARSCRPQRCP